MDIRNERRGKWTYDDNELNNARCDQWIFGGKITHVDDKEDNN